MHFQTPLKDLKRIQEYYTGTRFEVGKIPKGEADERLSPLTLAVQAKLSPSRTHNNNSSPTPEVPWQAILTKITPSRETTSKPKPLPNKYNKTHCDLKRDRSDTRLLASHYGKWYLNPKDFNQSMNEHKKKLQKNAIIKREIEAEAAAHEKGLACFKNKEASAPF